MHYFIEQIGAQFSAKDLPKLAELFSQRMDEGYRLHSVFQVSQPGCMGMGQPTTTNLAVYQRIETSEQPSSEDQQSTH
jgi:hypothetical protein